MSNAVEAAAADLNPVWTVTPGANPVLRLEFQRPIPSGPESQLLIRLSHPPPDPARETRQEIAFPDIVPLPSAPGSRVYVYCSRQPGLPGIRAGAAGRDIRRNRPA